MVSCTGRLIPMAKPPADVASTVEGSAARRVETSRSRMRRGRASLTDGPFAETKELIGGFWVIECDDLDQALAWAEKCALACRRPIEVRPFEDAQGT